MREGHCPFCGAEKDINFGTEGIYYKCGTSHWGNQDVRLTGVRQWRCYKAEGEQLKAQIQKLPETILSQIKKQEETKNVPGAQAFNNGLAIAGHVCNDIFHRSEFSNLFAPTSRPQARREIVMEIYIKCNCGNEIGGTILPPPFAFICKHCGKTYEGRVIMYVEKPSAPASAEAQGKIKIGEE